MIIYISESLNSKKNGGSSTSGYEFLQFLRIKYSKVVVITVDKLDLDKESQVFYGFKLNNLYKVIALKRRYPIKPFTLKKIAKKIYYALKDLLKKRSCDLSKFYKTDSNENIIFVNSWSGLFSEDKLRNINNFKKVCIVRGSPESFIWQSFEKDKKEAVKKAANYLEKFDRLIFVSKNGLNAWNEIFSSPIESFYLPNSINENEIVEVKKISPEKARAKLVFNKNSYNIVVVGSVQKRKAQDILLKIINELTKVIPNVKFHLVGGISDTWGGDVIYSDILTSEFKNYFVFHGHSNEPFLFMQAADLLLFTSRAEAFPRTVAEYMAMGKPIVAADVSGVNEMIKHNENGWLYNPFKIEELLQGIISVYKNKDLQIKFSKQAQETYYSKFSKEKHIANSLAVFDRIENE